MLEILRRREERLLLDFEDVEVRSEVRCIFMPTNSMNWALTALALVLYPLHIP